MRLVLTSAAFVTAAFASGALAQACNEKVCPPPAAQPDQAVAAANLEMQTAVDEDQAALRRREDAAWAARQAQIDAEQQAYQDRLAATQAEADRRTREHEAAVAAWRRRVAACQAGDVSQCAPQN